MWEYKKAFVWLWKSNSERISLDKRRKQKLTLGKQIIQKRNNSILNKKCSWIEPLDTLALFGFESISQALYDIIYIPSSNSWKRVKGEGNTEGPAGVHKVELIMHCSMVERGNSQDQLYKWSNMRVRNRTWHTAQYAMWHSLCPWFDLYLSYIKTDYLSTRSSILEIRMINY